MHGESGFSMLILGTVTCMSWTTERWKDSILLFLLSVPGQDVCTAGTGQSEEVGRGLKVPHAHALRRVQPLA